MAAGKFLFGFRFIIVMFTFHHVLTSVAGATDETGTMIIGGNGAIWSATFVGPKLDNLTKLTNSFSGSITDLVCDPRTNASYMIVGDQVLKRFANGTEQIFVESGLLDPQALALDWISGDIFILDFTSRMSYSINKCSQKSGIASSICSYVYSEFFASSSVGSRGSLNRVAARGNPASADLALLPEEKQMIWTKGGPKPGIMMGSMDEFGPSQTLFTTHSIPTSLTVSNGQIFWTEEDYETIPLIRFFFSSKDGSEQGLLGSVYFLTKKSSNCASIAVVNQQVWFRTSLFSEIQGIGIGRPPKFQRSELNLSTFPDLEGSCAFAMCGAQEHPIPTPKPTTSTTKKATVTPKRQQTISTITVPSTRSTPKPTLPRKNIEHKLAQVPPMLFISAMNQIHFRKLTEFESMPWFRRHAPYMNNIIALAHDTRNDSLIYIDLHKGMYRLDYRWPGSKPVLLIKRDFSQSGVVDIEIDPKTGNVFWMEEAKGTVETMNLTDRKLPRKVLQSGINNITDLLIVPELGSFFVSNWSQSRSFPSSSIQQFAMDGKASRTVVFIPYRILTFSYDKQTSVLVWIDTDGRMGHAALNDLLFYSYKSPQWNHNFGLPLLSGFRLIDKSDGEVKEAVIATGGNADGVSVFWLDTVSWDDGWLKHVHFSHIYKFYLRFSEMEMFPNPVGPELKHYKFLRAKLTVSK